MATLAHSIVRNPVVSHRRATLAASLIATRHRTFVRCLQTDRPASQIPDFAFCFDIDGVLLRSSTPIPNASKTLKLLQQHKIPFILLTNGGGRTEEERVADLNEKLDITLEKSMLVQSHTPYSSEEFAKYHKSTILVVGGDGGKCADAARSYGFENVVTPGDIVVAHPDIWPFSANFMDYYKSFARPLPKPINPKDPENSLKIDAIFVYNDSRDWGLDSTIMLDLLLSKQGILGTRSARNGDKSRPGFGYLQDGQPRIHVSNRDMWWASSHSQSRLGTGGFAAAFGGLWNRVILLDLLDQAPKNGVPNPLLFCGKPYRRTYAFAEDRLVAHREHLYGEQASDTPLRQVYMIGDNPESDIKGANIFCSARQCAWKGILVRTGVYEGGQTFFNNQKPTHIAYDVPAAVTWALQESKWVH